MGALGVLFDSADGDADALADEVEGLGSEALDEEHEQPMVADVAGRQAVEGEGEGVGPALVARAAGLLAEDLVELLVDDDLDDVEGMEGERGEMAEG
jgi:hypothetical protein